MTVRIITRIVWIAIATLTMLLVGVVGPVGKAHAEPYDFASAKFTAQSSGESIRVARIIGGRFDTTKDSRKLITKISFLNENPVTADVTATVGKVSRTVTVAPGAVGELALPFTMREGQTVRVGVRTSIPRLGQYAETVQDVVRAVTPTAKNITVVCSARGEEDDSPLMLATPVTAGVEYTASALSETEYNVDAAGAGVVVIGPNHWRLPLQEQGQIPCAA